MSVPFMRWNGWALPVGEGSAEELHVIEGGLDRRWDNRPSTERIDLSKGYTAQLFPLSQAQADTIVGMAEGVGDFFSFELGPVSSQGLVFDPTTPAGDLFTERSTTIPGYPLALRSTTSSVVVNPEFRDKWTVLVFLDATLSSYSHAIQRSDGAKWQDGVRDDTLDFTAEFVVSLATGAVGFTAAALDDGIAGLVLLPYELADDAVDAVYQWITGGQLAFRVPFEGHGDAADNTQLVAATMTGDIRRGGFFPGPGGTARAVEFASGEIADYGIASPQSDADAHEELTWEWWGRVDSALASGANGYAFVKNDGVTAAGYFIGHTGELAGAVADWGVVSAESSAGTLSAVTTNAPLTLDVWHHFAVVWRESAGSFALYLDGVLMGSVSAVSSPGAVLSDDSGVGFAIGNDPVGVANGWCGRIQDARLMRRAFSAAEIRERYLHGAVFRQPAPSARHYAHLPRIDVSGSSVGGKVLDALGDLQRDQAVRQHAPKEGGAWANNNREVPVKLRRYDPQGDDRLTPAPAYSIVQDDGRYRPGTSLNTLRPAHGPGNAVATLNGTQLWVPGPFGHGRARNHGDVAGQNTALPLLAGELLDTQHAASFAAWIRRVGTGTNDPVFELEIDGSASARMSLLIDAGDAINFVARSETTDAAQPIGNTLVMPDDEWAFFAGYVDLTDGQSNEGTGALWVWSEALGFQEELATGLTFGEEVFSGTSTVTSRIGSDLTALLGFNGYIKSVALYPGRVLTASEALGLARQGRRGIFR